MAKQFKSVIDANGSYYRVGSPCPRNQISSDITSITGSRGRYIVSNGVEKVIITGGTSAVPL